MVSKDELTELRAITQELFMFGEEYFELLLHADTRQREFEAISVDLAARFSCLAELIAQLADSIGETDYAGRFEDAPRFVSNAAKKYLSPLSWREK